MEKCNKNHASPMQMLKLVLKKVKGTDIELLLKESGLIQ